ncbi:MAG: sialate O-acetylesterase [Clostridiales bacterium]|nr:sialate O-acetylesterase [Clostridiales bacterium]
MKQAKIIILAGQSNAVGVGFTKYLSKHFDKKTETQFRNGYENVLINYSSHGIKSHGFVKTKTNCTESAKDTLGPEVGIAKKLSENLMGENFFIVKCAFGGSSLYNDWISPSDLRHISNVEVDLNKAIQCTEVMPAGWCYNELEKLLKESIELLINDGYTPTIHAFCWMQGESDTTKENVDAYIDRYDRLLDDLKSTFTPYFESCKFIEAGISTVWNLYQELNENKKNYAEKKGHIYIDTIKAGLTTTNEPEDAPDIYHYDCESVVRLGELFAEAIIEK